MKIKTKSQNMKLFLEAQQLKTSTRDAMHRIVVNSLKCKKENNKGVISVVCAAHNNRVNSDE